jgi:hypothetical protein
MRTTLISGVSITHLLKTDNILSKNERERYVFAHVFYLSRLWLGLSTYEIFRAGKVCFCVFVLDKKTPVDTL